MMSARSAMQAISEPEIARVEEALAPTRASERIVGVDIVRGFALVGIVVVNFCSSSLGGPEFAPQSGADRVVSFAIENFFNGKFHPLFSLLFGFGLGL